ncbi:3-dehydroquinate synthase [Gracilibacillus alcaliphilus]|uniref:3-dehydroquinate synthase n=1 Tax=Gracilibacillus alcaliphilus TaxID=1401441 RepID=UPI0019570920|nr:3-dehydroquinate synthase [Gracilibacillus alcaliphilus]MBM7675193.1 3-dehydroquinate synthase [Gracilibacillus alcaliphilus]
MHKQTIRTSSNQYDVIVGKGILQDINEYLPNRYRRILLITDSVVADLYADEIKEKLAQHAEVFVSAVPAGEASKSIEQYYQLLTDAIEHQLDRKSLIVALGGGMIGDLAGFVAATYMRGIDFIQVPTTILAHDSSVGGKVAINHPEGKNLIGNFYPPRAVLYDTDTLTSLSAKEIRSGYAEVIKHGFISDETFLQDVLQTDLTQRLSPDRLADHLQKGIAVKAQVVEADERESNVRKYLNFGHTLGHAIEAELGYGKITHGEAVAIGMQFALNVSENQLGVKLPDEAFDQWMKKNHYPQQLASLSVDRLLQRMKKDKKSENATVQMVLLEAIGKPIVKNIADEQLIPLLEKFIRELDS